MRARAGNGSPCSKFAGANPPDEIIAIFDGYADVARFFTGPVERCRRPSDGAVGAPTIDLNKWGGTAF